MKFLVGERRALVAAILAFYGMMLLLSGLFGGGVPPEIRPMIIALGALYAVAFFGLVAGWFWGRWYSAGLGMWGVVTGLFGMWQMGPEPVLVFFAATNAAVPLLLAGEAMAAGFEGREDWRTRFHLDDNAVHRLGKSVTRAAMSLPWLLLWAFMPKPAPELALAAAALGTAGVFGLLRMRTWGLLALTGATGAAGVEVAGAPSLVGVVVVVALAAAVAPLARPLMRRLAAD